MPHPPTASSKKEVKDPPVHPGKLTIKAKSKTRVLYSHDLHLRIPLYPQPHPFTLVLSLNNDKKLFLEQLKKYKASKPAGANEKLIKDLFAKKKGGK